MTNNMSGTAAEMPRYKCHKEVWALKIGAIEFLHKERPTIAELEAILAKSGEEAVTINPDGSVDALSDGAIMTPADSRYAPIKLSAAFIRKHGPTVGGYYVRYDDGYESFSPAKAFEDGYTLMQ